MRITAIAAVLTLGLTGVAAAATDPVVPFTRQAIEWKTCQDEELAKAGARCADVTVPLDYHNPTGRTITVAISRLAATGKGRIGVLMHGMGGGPGGRGLNGPALTSAAMGPGLAARYDLIGMDPRGVGRSTRINCGLTGEWLRSAGRDRAGFRRTIAYEKEQVARCQERHADLLPHITTRNTARDMDLIRALLKAPKMSYIGTSYGTYLGAVYTEMFPSRVDRLVLDSALDPARYPVRTFPDIGAANERYLDAWASWTAGRNAEYRLGATRRKVRATVEGIIAQAARRPLEIGQYRADEHIIPSLLAGIMSDDRYFADQAGVVRELHRAAKGEQFEPSDTLKEYLSPPDSGLDNALSMNVAIFCGDAPAPRDPEWYWRNIQRSRATQPVYGPLANTVFPCAFWPTAPVEAPTKVGNNHPALIVQSTGDTRTVYEGAVALHRTLPASRMVTLRNVRRHALYGVYPNRCVTEAVNAYLASGTLPKTNVTCQREPTA
ncbi:alpha/beta hydrolase [Actinomadura rudentiformis]|uniref:Alpha/beta hydrolase n=1 Tax=Actinomadura rudentiformis TaxID=359158 RepID=A0A6H9YQ07_9ACTN|nr:alpha/beta hydrolase [Actinomadura rudentiformis]KAB2349994.1 alpha/beta hydrolase [Actinomadura rudentiformis]